MITREQVAGLREGDVVELTSPEGVAVRGPLQRYGPEAGLTLGAGLSLRRSDGEPIYLWAEHGWSLTVVSRAPRPLYVNHPRTEPAMGDVVSRGDKDGATWSWCPLRSGPGRWRNTANDEWYAVEDFLDFGNGLRLLVDGETGQVVPDLAEVWAEGFEAAAEWAAHNPGPSGIPHDPPRNPYETGQVVPS